jgi:uncharacterized membrane protein
MFKRIGSLDFLRGLAMIFIILFHTSVYSFANINKLDFSNPPIVVVLISFMMLWGGIFLFYSGFINVFMLYKLDGEKRRKFLKYLLSAGLIYFILHYFLNIIFGRWSVDFVNNQPNMTVVAASIRNMHLTFPLIGKFFDGSTLSTIGLNLIILSLLFYFLFKNGGISKERRNYFILGISGTLIMLLSFVRIPLYHLTVQAFEVKNYLLATFYSVAIANPYPLLPYLAYVLLASMLGIMFVLNRKSLIKKVMLPLGVFFFIYGIIGCLNFPKTISQADYFWYFKTQMELGIFILGFIVFLMIFAYRNINFTHFQFIKSFSRISLTIYMLETLVSEIFRKILLIYNQSWDKNINSCLVFGLANVIVWIVILYFWKKSNFKYSLEYWWVIFFDRQGVSTGKLDDLKIN